MADTPNLTKGSCYGLLAFLCMAFFGVLTKAAATHVNPLWVSFITYATGAVAILLFVMPQGIEVIKTQHFLLHLGRSLFGCTASFLYMLSMHQIPIVNATLLFNSTPIFIPILAIFFLKATISTRTWTAIAIGFIGIVIIIKPNAAILTRSGDLLGLLSGIFLATAYLLIKMLTSTDPGRRIILYFFSLSTLFQLPGLFFAGPIPAWHHASLAVGAGLSLLLAQTFLVQGYRFADVSQVGVYQYTTLVYVAIIDWLTWKAIPTF
jgi:drug/metabolite transporter (DMT)-like permease